MKWAKLSLILISISGLVALRPGQPAKPGKWVNLFNGKNLDGWHVYNQSNTEGWGVENGLLTSTGKGGDLVTDKEYGDFDLEFEFKIPPQSNSGIFYKVIEKPEITRTVYSGPEYQIIDDKGYIVKGANGERIPLLPTQLSGANYDMHPPKDPNVFTIPDKWNKGRIVVRNNQVQHYLNGKLVVDYEYGGEEWKRKVAAGKYKGMPYEEPHHRGKIALQNHNAKEKIWFKKIRIKEL